MKRLFVTACVAALVVASGCNNKSSLGGPGAGSSANKSVIGAAKGDTFRISVPATSTTLKQGEQKDVKISVDRGSTLKQDITLKFTSEAKGVTVEQSNYTLTKDASPTDIKFTVKAADDAAIGEHEIKVTGTPETGSATDATFKVKVTGK